MRPPVPLDVVVPVAPGDDAAACIAAIVRHGGYRQLIVVTGDVPDESPSGAAHEATRGESLPPAYLRVDGAWSFAAGANRGIGVTRGDVVVVRPSARPMPRWLAKLAQCADTDEQIGVVVPFSPGTADLLSETSAGSDAEAIDAAVEAAAVPLYPDLLPAVAPCAMLRRVCVEKTRGFDGSLVDPDEAMADLALRARGLGFRVVLADDTYVDGPVVDVRPIGAGRLAERHPALPAIVDRFVEDEPFLPLRVAASSQLARLRGRDRPGVLHVLHARGGGTEKHVRELIVAMRDRFRHYFLRILPDRFRVLDLHGAIPDQYDYRWQLADTGDGSSSYDFPREGGDWRWLPQVCEWLSIDLCHVHSLVGSDASFAGVLATAGIPYCYTAHDMYLPCPTIHLIDDRGEYCNATTDVSTCRRCLAALGGYADVDIASWRERHRAFLAQARHVFAPSRWGAETLATYFPGFPVDVIEPPPARRADNGPATTAPFALPDDECRHVALLGAIGPEKGSRILEAFVARIRERALPLRIVVIGYTDRETRGQSADRVLTVHGPYGVGEVATLLDRYRVGVVLFPNVWPETFSYTLGEVWAAGRPALVPTRGALKDRIDATGAGWVLDGWPDVDRMLDQVLQVTAPENAALRAAAIERARAAAHESGDDAIAARYRTMIGPSKPRATTTASRRVIHEAACRALGREPLPMRASMVAGRAGWPYRPLLRLFRRRA